MAEVASQGFPPVARPNAKILILGSLPGQRSLTELQYYAHPQNAFWPIMRELFSIEGDYRSRCLQLVQNDIALWDVLHQSVRPGSMDADIRTTTATANDFPAFLAEHIGIHLIAFNGRKAEELFGRFIDESSIGDHIVRVSLPSTSPAYASMPFSGKLSAWADALLPALQEN